MTGPTNRRRSSRILLTALAALVAQVMLVGVSPLADVHYHEHVPLGIGSTATHQASHGPDQCPECLALQTLAIPGSPTCVLRSNWARTEAPTPAVGISSGTVRITSTLPRAPPLSPLATL